MVMKRVKRLESGVSEGKEVKKQKEGSSRATGLTTKSVTELE